MQFIIHYKEINSFTIIWMQIGKNMVKTPKLVYVLILFLSIFFSIIVSNSFPDKIFFGDCQTDKDCKPKRGVNFRCRKGKCFPVR
jgi:hypothetical protein